MGSSGHGKVLAETAECCGWTDIVFFDDAWPSCVSNGVWKVVGSTDQLLLRLQEFDGVIVAIGNNSIRQAKLELLVKHNAVLATLVHPAATVSRYAKLGLGSVVLPGAVINAGASVGGGGILNTGSSVDHDCILGESVHVSPGARLAGGVILGNRTWIGIGACVKQMVSIGEDVIVGAGAAVITDVKDRATVVGVPARVIK